MKSGGNKGTFFSPNIDYILVYAKNINKVSPFRADLGDELIEKVYNYTEKSGKRKGQNFRVMGLYQAGLDVRPNQRYWIKCPDDSFVIPPGDTYPSTVKEGNKITPNDGDGVWRWTYPRYKKELEKNNILFKKTNRSSLIDKNGNSSKWNVYTKIWLKDRMEDGKVPVNLISKFENRHSSQELKDLDIPFSFAKPVGLIKYLMKIVDIEDNEVVLDFFSGSGTTAHAVMKQNIEEKENIKFIMVQLPEPTPENSDARKAGFKTISDIGKERIRRGGEKLNEENKDNDNIENLDIGFKVFKLDSSNLKTWDVSLEDDLEQNLFDMVDNIKDDRAEEDILYEVLLKYGLDLTLPIEKLEIKNKSVYVIGFGALVICLDKEIDLELVEEIGKLKEKYQPEIMRVVFKDSGFKNDVVKTNAIQILEKYNIDDVKSL
jgi:adenine-specific DNA-methyltransferase